MKRMTNIQVQERLCDIMRKLDKGRDDCEYVPRNFISDDLDFLDTLVSYTLLDLEAQVREAKIRGKNGS